MAEGDITFYNNIKEFLLGGVVDLDSDTIKVALLGSGYSFSADGNIGYANISANEITASGYSAGGKALTGLTITQDDTNDRAKWDAADLTWTSLATATIAHAVPYDDTITTPVADPTICRVEISTNSNGGDYTLQWNANGIGLLS